MKSAEAEIFAGIHPREADVSAVLGHLAVAAVIDLVGNDRLPGGGFEREVGNRKLHLETGIILLGERMGPHVVVRD